MLNEEEILVINKQGKDITANVVSLSYSKVEVKYNNKTYSYNRTNLHIIDNPIVLKNCCISTSSTTLSNVVKAIRFENYIKVFF